MTIDKNFFRRVMGHFPSGVTIVTNQYQGKPGGLTVSSFVSLSLDPPLVLICVDNNSHTLPGIRASKAFAVNFLTEEQAHLSRCFAIPSSERFEHFCYASYHIAATGSPILDNILAFVDTRLVAEYPGGDHVILVGQVEALGVAGEVVFAQDSYKNQSTLIHYHDYQSDVTSNGKKPEREAAPLAYYRGRYRHLAEFYEEPSLNPPQVTTGIQNNGTNNK